MVWYCTMYYRASLRLANTAICCTISGSASLSMMIFQLCSHWLVDRYVTKVSPEILLWCKQDRDGFRSKTGIEAFPLSEICSHLHLKVSKLRVKALDCFYRIVSWRLLLVVVTYTSKTCLGWLARFLMLPHRFCGIKSLILARWSPCCRQFPCQSYSFTFTTSIKFIFLLLLRILRFLASALGVLQSLSSALLSICLWLSSRCRWLKCASISLLLTVTLLTDIFLTKF